MVPEVNIDLLSGREKRTLAPASNSIEHRLSFKLEKLSGLGTDRDS